VCDLLNHRSRFGIKESVRIMDRKAFLLTG
jgi:hypothetical protein